MVVLLTFVIISYSYILLPVVPIFYNTSLLLGNKNYLKKKDEFIIIIPEQLASVNTIAVMPVQVTCYVSTFYKFLKNFFFIK